MGAGWGGFGVLGGDKREREETIKGDEEAIKGVDKTAANHHWSSKR